MSANSPLPGDLPLPEQVRRMIRVDHAGEHGAASIYEGQLAVLGKRPVADAIRAMATQERQHRAAFDALLVERRVRPSLLGPLWNAAGFALGAATALMGEKAAMACTVAVEEVIDDHYRQQSEALGAQEPALKQVIDEFRADEMHHRDTALEHGAVETPGYEVLSVAIKTGSRLAIWLATRI